MEQLLLTFDVSENMADHLNELSNIVNKLTEMNISVSDDLLSIIILHSLPNDYENFRCAIKSMTLPDELPDPQTLRIKLLEESEIR